MKILIIRFSSIGDLTQALSLPSFIALQSPQTEIHFVTRFDLAPLLQNHPHINKIWSLDKNTGFRGLLHLITQLKKENFTHIYDAHNNLRSFLIRFLIRKPMTLVRPMMRFKRFLLLRFHKNLFEMPFSGQRDLIKPLEKWGFKFQIPDPPQIFLAPSIRTQAAALIHKFTSEKYFILVPSAAYELKRWPLIHWEKLVQLNPLKTFVVLAGPEDQFTSSLNKFKNVINLTGKTSLLESAALIERAQAVVSNDTGLLHISEQLGRPTLALMGPAPFGFPSRTSTVILERQLKCRPCSKHGQGPCVNPIFQECLHSITPQEVTLRLDSL